jgi:dTMP kinase
VAASLDHLSDPAAWSLRQSLWERAPDAVVGSLVGDDSPAAWILREEWLDCAGGEAALHDARLARVLCGSLRGVAGERAFALRLAGAAGSPVGALLSLTGLTDERAWSWRERQLGAAPRPVMRTLDGLVDGRAFLLRETAIAGCKEALDSIVGLDDERAWALRERALDLWPSTVVKSLGGLGQHGRGREVVERQLARHPSNVSLLKHAAALAMPAHERAQAAS